MSYHRTRFWYSGTEDVSFTFYDGYAIDFPTGVSTLDATLDTVRSPDGIGSAVQQATVPERNVSINGYVVGFPSEEYRRGLERSFAPLSSGRLWAETEAHELFYLDCISAGTPVIEGIRNKPRFQVALVAQYPYWQRDTYEEFLLSMNGTAGNFSQKIISDVPALFQMDLTASTGCQSAYVIIGGNELRYNGAIAAGQTLSVQVDPAGRVTAMLGVANVIGNVTGNLKKLPAGAQTIRLEAPGNSGTVTVKMKYKEAKAGV